MASIYLATFMCLGVFGLLVAARHLWNRWERSSWAFVIGSALALSFFATSATRVVVAGVQVIVERGLQ